MAQTGFGATFQLSATTIADITTGKLLEVLEVGFPDPVTGTTETTNHDSPGAVREYLPDLVNLDPVPVKMNYTPGSATDIACEAAAYARALYYFKARVPIAGGATFRTFTGQCIVVSYKRDPAKTGGALTATLTIQPTSSATRTTV
jgi:hypothetical protein